MINAQVVETLDTVTNNSYFDNCTSPENDTKQTKYLIEQSKFICNL